MPINGDVEIPGAHVLDHFRFVAELAGGEELDFHLAFGPGFHDLLEPGADGPISESMGSPMPTFRMVFS